MNVRGTSLIAYRMITSNGLLSDLRMKAYRTLAEHGPMTASELDVRMGGRRSDGGRRLSELRRLGVVCETRKRPCSVTGNLVIEWDITNDLPSNDDDDHISQSEKLKIAQRALRDIAQWANGYVDETDASVLRAEMGAIARGAEITLREIAGGRI